VPSYWLRCGSHELSARLCLKLRYSQSQSPKQVARITGMSHQCLTNSCFCLKISPSQEFLKKISTHILFRSFCYIFMGITCK
jgi:hypothetical protein